MKIEITVSSPQKYFNLYLDTNTNVFECNGTPTTYDPTKFKNKLFDIIFTWKNNLLLPGIIDAETYEINIEIEANTFHYIGNSVLPENYNEFCNLLEEVDTHGKMYI